MIPSRSGAPVLRWSRQRRTARRWALVYNQIGEIVLDIVTLIRYTVGTVKNCESGPSTGSGRAGQAAAAARFVWAWIPALTGRSSTIPRE
jgi:hypothetical protein